MKNQELAKKWIELKTKEAALKEDRLKLEQAICLQAQLKPTGANNFENMLTITTGFDRKWDQDGLAELALRDIEPFPFNLEYKEDRTLTKGLEAMAPDFWSDIYEPLLTVKPKKASFKVR